MLDLLNDAGDSLAPAVARAVTEAFHRSDADDDGGLSVADLQHFAKWCNAKTRAETRQKMASGSDGKAEESGVTFVGAGAEKTDAYGAVGWEFSDAEIAEVFGSFDFEAVPKLGKRLTSSGFEDLWHLQCGADAEASAADLQALGYNVEMNCDYGSVDGDGKFPDLPLVALVCEPGCERFWTISEKEVDSCAQKWPENVPVQQALVHQDSSQSRKTLSVLAVRSLLDLFVACGAFAPFSWQRVPILHAITDDDGADWRLSYGALFDIGQGRWRLKCRERHAEGAKREATDTQAKIDAWLKRFGEKRAKLSDTLQKPSFPGEYADVDAAITALSEDLGSLRSLLAENPGIPTHDVASSQKDCDRLAADISEAKERWQPRKKFSFKSRRNVKASATSAVKSTAEGRDELPSAESNQSAAETVRDLADTTIDQFSVEEPARRYVNLKNCVVLAPPVAGSVYIDGCTDCKFYLGSQQLRIHDTTNSDFMLFVKSGPIIEGCNAVRFGPYLLQFDNRDEKFGALDFNPAHIEKGPTNLFEQVNDFKWLKTQHSPHWSLLDDSKGVQELEQLRK